MFKVVRNIAINAALAGVIFTAVNFARAAVLSAQEDGIVESILRDEAVSLEIENPGILSSNPFYFVKNLRRSTLRVFVFGAAKKAELELGILAEKAAEIKRLTEILPEDANALMEALDSYRNTLERLRYYIRELERGDSVDDLFSGLLNRALKHLKFFDELKRAANPAINPECSRRIEILQDKLSEAALIALAVDGPDNFKRRFLNVLDSQRNSMFKELRAVEALDRFEEKLAFDSAGREVISKLKEDLLLKAEVKIGDEKTRSVLPPVLGRLPGDAWRRIKILDEAREYVTNAELRNDLTLARQFVLDSAGQSRAIGKPEAGRLLKEAGGLNELLGEKSPAISRYSALKTLASRADFNLKQAETLMAGGQYVQSFGQASVASAAAKNALNQLSRLGNLGAEIQELKLFYDKLVGAAAANNFVLENMPKLEELLAAVSDLANKNSKLDKAIPALREIKVLLAAAELELKSLLAQLAEAAEKDNQSFLERVLSTR